MIYFASNPIAIVHESILDSIFLSCCSFLQDLIELCMFIRNCLSDIDSSKQKPVVYDAFQEFIVLLESVFAFAGQAVQ